MTELSFAKTFLSTLDARPLKLQPDYTANPKTLSVNGPYTLPKMASAFKRPNDPTSSSSSSPSSDPTTAAAAAGGQKAVVDVTLKSSKNPVWSLGLPGTEMGATVLELKERVARELRLGGTEKIRVLYRKKPVGDVKTLKELLAANEDDDKGEAAGLQELELGVMVMGYNKEAVAGDVAMTDGGGATSVVAQGGPSGRAEEEEGVLGKEEFWADLRGFLMQRLRDEGKAGEVFARFRESWEKR